MSAWLQHHIGLGSASFEYVESIHEVKHKVGRERICCRIANVTIGNTSVYIASLLQNIVNLESNGSVFLFYLLFL